MSVYRYSTPVIPVLCHFYVAFVTVISHTVKVPLPVFSHQAAVFRLILLISVYYSYRKSLPSY